MDRFTIAQAHYQLENDYNVSGMLRERMSNIRRNESTGVQLHRIGFQPIHVDILGYSDDTDDEDVREVYMLAVLRMGLPIGPDLRKRMIEFFNADFLSGFVQFQSFD